MTDDTREVFFKRKIQFAHPLIFTYFLQILSHFRIVARRY